MPARLGGLYPYRNTPLLLVVLALKGGMMRSTNGATLLQLADATDDIDVYDSDTDEPDIINPRNIEK